MKTPNRHRQDKNDGDCVKKGPWSAEEDEKLRAYIKRYGIWIWDHMPKAAGLARTGKSCRLRWMNYLRPNIRHGKFTSEEEETVIKWQRQLGNRWSTIATKLPGRTDNEIKNYWNSRLKKRILDDDNAVDATTSQPMDSSNDEQKPNLEGDTCGITRTTPIDLESLPKEVTTEASTSSAGSLFSSSSSHSDITFQHDKEQASSLKADDNKALRLIQFL